MYIYIYIDIYIYILFRINPLSLSPASVGYVDQLIHRNANHEGKDTPETQHAADTPHMQQQQQQMQQQQMQQQQMQQHEQQQMKQ